MYGSATKAKQFLIFCRAERKDHHWIIQKSFLLYYIIAGFFFCVIESSVYHAQWVQTKHTRFKGRKIGENTTNDSVSETWYLLKKRLLKLSHFLVVGKSNILFHHDQIEFCEVFIGIFPYRDFWKEILWVVGLLSTSCVDKVWWCFRRGEFLSEIF